MRLCVALVLSAILAIPARAEPFDKPPRWDTGCESATKDQFGDRKRQYCFLAVNNDPGINLLMDNNSFVMRYEVLLEVDAAGVKIIKPRPRQLCEAHGAPTRIAVDGRRIDGLPVIKQVQAMLAGRRLVWEEQAEWPYCGIAPHGTYLDGMRQALERLRAQWAEIATR
jgi:hypothetical protein